jgi:hypothetical protein
MPRKLEDIYNECLDLILSGKSVEDCLHAFPEQAAELRPLLEMSASINSQVDLIKPNPVLKASIMLRLDEALLEKQRRLSHRRSFIFGFQPRWATAAAAILVVMVVGGVSVARSGASQPDDILYPLKLTAEQARLALTFSDATRNDLRLQMAENRINEIAYLAGKGDTAAIDGLVQNLENNLDVALSPAPVVAPSPVTTTAPRTMAPAPAPAPAPLQATSPAPVPASDVSPAASVPADAPAKTSVSGTSSVTSLSRSEARSLAVLEEAFKTAPESAKPEIKKAIERIKRAYEKAASKPAK